MKKIIILKNLSVKHLIILLFTGTLCLPLSARNENDTIYYREKKGKTFIIKSEYRFKNRKYYTDLFLDFGYNRLDNRNMFTGTEHASAADFPRLRNSASRSFSMYLMFGRKISGSLSIMSGMGIDWVNYRFSKDVTIIEINDVATQAPITSVISNFSHMKKTQLAGSYLNVPLLLRIHFHRFFVAAGVTGGLNIGSHTKVVFLNTNGKKQTYKDHDIHLATFRYGYTVRAGFRCLSLFTNYYVSPLFEKDKGPQVYPFSMGISLKL